MVKHIYTYDDPPHSRDINSAISILERDGVMAYPTDVNWAFACDARSVKALERIRMLKPHHPKIQPFTLICNSISMISGICNIEQSTYRILRRILPGPFTILLNRNRSLPKQIHDNRKVVGVRFFQSQLVSEIINGLQGPLASTSVPIKEIEEGVLGPRWGYEVVEEYAHALDLVLDLSKPTLVSETTILDLTDESHPRVIRQGIGDSHGLVLPEES